MGEREEGAVAASGGGAMRLELATEPPEEYAVRERKVWVTVGFVLRIRSSGFSLDAEEGTGAEEMWSVVPVLWGEREEEEEADREDLSEWLEVARGQSDMVVGNGKRFGLLRFRFRKLSIKMLRSRGIHQVCLELRVANHVAVRRAMSRGIRLIGRRKHASPALFTAEENLRQHELETVRHLLPKLQLQVASLSFETSFRDAFPSWQSWPGANVRPRDSIDLDHDTGKIDDDCDEDESDHDEDAGMCDEEATPEAPLALTVDSLLGGDLATNPTVNQLLAENTAMEQRIMELELQNAALLLSKPIEWSWLGVEAECLDDLGRDFALDDVMDDCPPAPFP